MQTSIGVSITLAKVVNTTIAIASITTVQIGVERNNSAVGVTNQSSIGISIGITLANVVNTSIASIATIASVTTMQVRVEGNNSSVGVTNQSSIGISISIGIGITLANVVNTSIAIASITTVQVRVEGNNSSVGVTYQSSVGISISIGISLGFSITLAKVMIATKVGAGYILAGQVGGSGGLVGGVERHNGAVAVLHQTGAGIPNSAHKYQISEHGWLF